MFAREGVDRAYLYFFNDDDTPHVHGSSGLTRNFVPKPSFHAAAWLHRSLADYRFQNVVREEADGAWIYEFTHESGPQKRVFAVWKPSGAASAVSVSVGKGQILKSERMPMKDGTPESVEISTDNGTISLEGWREPGLRLGAVEYGGAGQESRSPFDLADANVTNV
jgi:hypothetical protein